MAKTNVPNQPGNNGDSRKREQAARTKKQKGYQESLSYERAFLKKKSELNHSAEMQQRQKAIEERRKLADEEMRIARLTIRNKEDLQRELSNIQARFAAETAAMQRELVSEREKNEYAAHLFAADCARKAAQSQNLRQRAQTAAALADAQKVQTARLRNTKELEIADLQAQKKSSTTAEARKDIDAQIRKLRREIAAAEKEDLKSQESAADLAKKAAEADFARLSVKDKLKQKQKELTALQAEADAAIDEIELQISEKEVELKAAKDSGKSEKTTDKLEKEIADLQNVLDSTKQQYDASIHELTDQIEKTGGLREQAKKESGTRVTPVVPPIVVPPPVVSVLKEDKPTVDTEDREPRDLENVSSVDLAAQISLVLSGLQTFETAFANYVDAVDSMVTPEATEESVDGVVPLDTTSAENTLKDSSAALINQLRALVDQSVNGDIELQSQLNAKIDELNQSLNSQLSGLSTLPNSLSDSYATSVSDLVSEITDAVTSHVTVPQSNDRSVPSIIVPPPVQDSQLPSNLTLDDTAVVSQLSLIQQTLSTFETALTSYANVVGSVVTPEITEENVDGRIPFDTSGAENAIRDTSSLLIDQLRTLVNQSVNGNVELQNQLNAKIDTLTQGLHSQLGNLAGLPESLSGGYASAVSDLIGEITGAVTSYVGLSESDGSDVPSIIVPPPVVDTQIPDKLTFEDASMMGQIVLIQQTLSTFVSTFENYLNTIDSRFSSSDRAIQSAMAARTPVAPAPTSDSAYEQLAALRATLSANDSVSDDIRDSLVAELDRIESRLDTGMEVDLTSISDSILKLGDDISFEDLGKYIRELQSSLENDLLEGKGLNDLDPVKMQAIATGRNTQSDNDKMNARLEARLANLAQIEKNKKFFSKGAEGAAYRKEVVLEAAFEKMQDALDGLADLSKTIDNNINEYFRYQAEIDAKLQGTDLDYSDMLKTLTNNLGMSMLVSQKDYITKFKELVDAGIAHNMETRAFLATVSDKVVNTFNAFDANLLRLVRIQQQDTTAARLGLESSLNKLFNSYFSDSSYLSDSGPHDSISAAILEASSMLSNDMSVEFEYMVHKWLGSLYSLGMSSDTLESIAQGLNYLGTGNVAALNSNESLQTLLAMSAARGGESYAEILVNGLDADTTNNLLQGMITYLMEIASNTDNNQVTKSAYSDLFGMHMSDLRSIVNMTETDITSLANLTTSYSQAVNETQNQLGQIISRTHMSQMVETLFDNAVLGASLDIGKDPVGYGLWKTLNVVEGLTGGIALPFVNVFGSGLDLNTTVTQLAKGAMAGLSMMSNLIGALGSGGLSTGMDINEWNNTEMTARGTGSSFFSSGTASGFSSSARLDYAGSGSSGDIKKTEMSDATDSAKEDSEVTNKYAQEEQAIPEQIYEQTSKIYAALAEDDLTLLKQSIRTHNLLEEKLESLGVLTQMSSLLGLDRVFITSDAMEASALAAASLNHTNNDSTTSFLDLQNYENQASVLQKVSSVFSSVIANSSDLVGASVDIWSLIDASSDLSATTMKNELNSQYSSDNSGFNNFNQSNRDVNTQLINHLASTLNNSSTITTEEMKQFAQLQQLNKIVFPEYVRATIDDLAPNVKKYTEELLKRAVEMSLYGTDVETDYEDETLQLPLVKQLIEALTNSTNVLTVRQSSF